MGKRFSPKGKVNTCQEIDRWDPYDVQFPRFSFDKAFTYIELPFQLGGLNITTVKKTTSAKLTWLHIYVFNWAQVVLFTVKPIVLNVAQVFTFFPITSPGDIGGLSTTLKRWVSPSHQIYWNITRKCGGGGGSGYFIGSEHDHLSATSRSEVPSLAIWSWSSNTTRLRKNRLRAVGGERVDEGNWAPLI